tara:strand:- start:10645 stop:11175 length:531 start_codon:yes stop_codon:yes gene_type:complete
MLIDNIKRYDKEGKIKLVCIHDLISENIGIEKTIHSVPAFMILPSKELLFGKSVFDHLLLPGRGILSNTQNTRLERPETTNNDINELKASKPIENIENPDEPSAYSLAGFNFSDGFSSIDEENVGECKDKGYNWDYINNDKTITDEIGEFKMSDEASNSMPSLDELKRMRDEIKFD